MAERVEDKGLILPLCSAEATLARAGGKGASLAALTRAGFAVPPGFVVTTDAYRAFVEANGIGARLLELAEAVSPDDPTALEATSKEIRALFGGGIVPGEIAASIQFAYASMPRAIEGDPPVAVRSSATAEDLPGLSFAGQQDTYLNIIGPDAVLEAVKTCWGSLWTARAIGYRARNRIPSGDLALAVVVQRMVSAEVSGVVFTANPLTGHRGETVVDASFGLGEAIVSGRVEPDHYVISRPDLRIVSRKLGAKALAVLPRREGGTETLAQEKSQQQALTDAQILELARTAGRVADHFASPQDIEWAVADGKLYVLQSRPITSLYPVSESLLRSENLRVFFSLNSLQGVVEPFTPLGRDVLTLLFTGIFRNLGVRRSIGDIVIAAGGRLFIDATVPLSDRRLRRLILLLLANADPGAREAALGLISSGRIETTAVVGLARILRLILGFRPVIVGAVKTWLRPMPVRERAVRKADNYVAEVRQAIESHPARRTPLEARLDLVDHYAPSVLPKVIFKTLAPTMIPGLLAIGVVDRWLVAWAGAEPGAVRRLLRGLPGNPTTQMDLKLWAEAEIIRSDTAARAAFESLSADEIATAYEHGELPSAAQEALRRFLDEYGMRAVGEIDIGRARWREDPRSIIQSLRSFLQIGDPDLAPDRLFRRAGAQAEHLAAAFVDGVRQRKGRLRARLLGAAIRRMRLLAGMREMPKFYLVKLLDALRTALLDSGRSLVAERKLEHAEDIFFVPLDTLRSLAKGEGVDLRAIASRERAEYERELTRRQIPRLLLSTGEVFYQGVAEAGAEYLTGDGVSPGTVEGKVRVVHDPRGVRLEPGEILVCPATDPGWTPLFLSAGGLVMELGGMMTHGSVVAREYGIPAVVGVHDATRRLRTGQLVRVDGGAGRVVVLEE
ncbi:MAG: phosphoenolpyruvate synthase [Chloroflexi bacterium]|nr:phosphoenolpyruvate synthase [Chloroflexota bacterium]